MPKERVKADAPYAYIVSPEQDETPLTYEELVRLVRTDSLADDTKIRRHNEGDWKRVADTHWLMYLEEQIPDFASQLARKRTGETGLSRSMYRVVMISVVSAILVPLTLMFALGSIAFGVALAVITVFVIIGIWNSRSEEYAEASKAYEYLEQELAKWQQGLPSEANFKLTSSHEVAVALEDFTAVDINKNMFLKVGYDITVELGLVFPPNQRKRKKHIFTVKWNGQDQEWQFADDGEVQLTASQAS